MEEQRAQGGSRQQLVRQNSTGVVISAQERAARTAKFLDRLEVTVQGEVPALKRALCRAEELLEITVHAILGIGWKSTDTMYAVIGELTNYRMDDQVGCTVAGATKFTADPCCYFSF